MPMPKPKVLTALEVAYMMGFEPQTMTPDGRRIRLGSKALVGQYTRPYVREDGSQGVLDYSAVINSKRGRYGR